MSLSALQETGRDTFASPQTYESTVCLLFLASRLTVVRHAAKKQQAAWHKNTLGHYYELFTHRDGFTILVRIVQLSHSICSVRRKPQLFFCRHHHHYSFLKSAIL